MIGAVGVISYMANRNIVYNNIANRFGKFILKSEDGNILAKKDLILVIENISEVKIILLSMTIL
jgi:hypothetical protein